MTEKEKEEKSEKKYLYAIMVMMVILAVSIPILSYITVRNSEIIFHVYDTSNDTKEIVKEVHLTANATQIQAEINQNQSVQNSKQISSLNESFINFAQDRNKAFNITLKNQNESFANQRQILKYQIANELQIIDTEKNVLGNLTDHRRISNLSNAEELEIANNNSKMLSILIEKVDNLEKKVEQNNSITDKSKHITIAPKSKTK